MKRKHIGLGGIVPLFVAMATAGAALDGSFIQLHRGKADRTTEEWRTDFQHIKALGGDRVIVQWTAEEPVLYFGADTNILRGMTEVYPVLERIFEAAEAENISVVLGLQHHPEFWDQIKSRDKVIQDFFRIRKARNRQLQLVLLNNFGDRTSWTGYYLPDEIDDLTWRSPNKKKLIHGYLRAMAGILRENDPDRTIAVSSFFRGRTVPKRMAEDLMDILSDTGIDYLLVQDGVGVGDPPLAYVPLYYEVLARTWASESAAGRDLPALWGVLEAFKQTSGPDEPFTAVPAPPERLREQVEEARPFFDRLILFTFEDYLQPDLGHAATAAFESLRAITD